MTDNEQDRVSGDLPYELQSKMFDQLAAMSLGGAGLTVTLIGSTLRNAPPIVWLAVIEFGLAALACMVGNIQLIEGLFKGVDRKSRNRIMTYTAVLLMCMGIGSLSMSIYFESHGRPSAKHFVNSEREK